MDEDALRRLRLERADLGEALEAMDAAKARGLEHPKGYRAEFFRQQLAEIDELILQMEAEAALSAPD